MDYEKTNLMMQSFNDNRGEDTEDEIWILEHEPFIPLVSVQMHQVSLTIYHTQ